MQELDDKIEVLNDEKRKEVMTILKRCDSTMTKWARRGYLVPSMVGGKHLYRKADVMRILNGGRM